MKILVTNATKNAGFVVIRAFTESGSEVIGTDDRKLPFGIHSHHTKSNYLYADVDSDRFFESLIKIIRKEKPDVLLPVAGTSQISLHRAELLKFGNFFELPDIKENIAKMLCSCWVTMVNIGRPHFLDSSNV